MRAFLLSYIFFLCLEEITFIFYNRTELSYCTGLGDFCITSFLPPPLRMVFCFAHLPKGTNLKSPDQIRTLNINHRISVILSEPPSFFIIYQLRGSDECYQVEVNSHWSNL